MSLSAYDSTTGLTHIAKLISAGQQQLSDRLELPEPSVRLDIASRNDDQTRVFKHLHQSCMLHSSIFQRVNQVKLVYLLDAYRIMVEQKNPAGIYAMARSILELAAFLADVARRLSPFSDARTLWQDRGVGFFRVIVRARFGTSDPQKQRALVEAGISKDDVKPFHILTCIDHLAKDKANAWVRPYYDFLCDYVHRNMSSQTISAAEMTHGGLAISPGGGMIYMMQHGPIVVNQYPANNQAEYAREQTAPRAASLADLALRTLNALPNTPYSEAELVEKTGYRLGVKALARPLKPDDLCFCGSGMNYGRCHVKRQC